MWANQKAYDCGNKLAKKYDLIVANPPYYNEDFNQQRKNSTLEQKLATHEINLNLEQLVANSARIIEQKGYLAIVLPMARYIDTICLLRKYNFEPKRIQLVYPRITDTQNSV